jgi:hypothetical protein
MGNLAQSAERGALKAIWGGLSPLMGSSHPHYRQALWCPTRQGLEAVSLSDRFTGDTSVSKWNRRAWDSVGVVAVRNGALEELLDQPGSRPAAAFTMGNMLVVGEIDGDEPLGRLVTASGEIGDVAHGFRIGHDAGQYALGIIAANGEFVTPDQEDVYTMGPIDITFAIQPGSGFANINFS